MKSSRWLAFVVALQVAVLLGQWTGQPAARTAHADVQLPNPGERQLTMIDQLKSINGKMDTLVNLLQNGDAKVEVTKVDHQK